MTNGTEIRIAALRRTGQHAIIGWIVAQAVASNGRTSSSLQQEPRAESSVTFLNDVKPGQNPFVSCTKANELAELPVSQRVKKGLIDRLRSRDWLIYNYEDRRLSGVFSQQFENEHNRFVGKSGTRFDVIIIRDVFNFFASRLAFGSWLGTQLANEDGRDRIAKLWKIYAREYLGETHFRRHLFLAINYNRWCVDRAYRECLAKRLGLQFTDAGFQSVDRHYGGGSSFDRARLHGQAQQMQLTQRWKVYANDPLFRSIFRDQELIDLSHRIFGRIDGTEVLYEPLPARDGRWRSRVRLLGEN